MATHGVTQNGKMFIFSVCFVWPYKNNSLMFNLKLFVPGYVCYFHEDCGSRQLTNYGIANKDLQQMILTPKLISDHMPMRVKRIVFGEKEKLPYVPVITSIASWLLFIVRTKSPRIPL
jgi:hypothetical protein